MKCRVCGRQAHLALRAYNTALCADDFTAFLEKRVLQTINKYNLIGKEDTTLIAVSGGKDSLALWSIVNKLGYEADGFYINLGIDNYSGDSFEKSCQMARKLQRKLYSFSLSASLNKGIKDLSQIMRRVPCSICGTIKRYVMNRACMEHGYTILATGHNLDDEASSLLGNLLHWKEEYLWKKGVVLEGDEHLAKKIKPLFLCSEKEVAAYAVMNNIDYIYEECPYSVGAKTILYKGLLNKVEEVSPATKLRFLKGYLSRAKEEGKRREESEEGNKPKEFCTTCGYPSFAESCNFCRLLERFGIEGTVSFQLYDPCAS